MVREEQWTKPAGGSMLGMGRAVANAKMVEFEFMRIHEDKGEIFYTARPSGQAEASFKLVSLNGQSGDFRKPTARLSSAYGLAQAAGRLSSCAYRGNCEW